MMKRVAAMFVLSLLVPALAAAQQCLHGPDSTAEQKARKKAALGAARQVNTLQANTPEAQAGKYLKQSELAPRYAEVLKRFPSPRPLNFDPNAEILPGWQLTLDTSEKGYWFMIKDKTDPCGFAYISNQEGVIYTAEPLR